jgi:hypothetical protein
MEAPEQNLPGRGEQTKAGGNIHTQKVINRLTLPRDPWQLITATLLALSIAMNVTAYYKMRDIDTRKWLHDYDLNQFQMNQFAALQKEVEVDHELIRVFGPQNCQKPAGAR